MDLRSLVDGLFAVLGTTSLTDAEFESIQSQDVSFTVQLYGALLAVLDGREAVSDTRERLRFYFLSRGIPVGEITPPKSNIFYGSVL